jgi:predicted Zn-dependent protease
LRWLLLPNPPTAASVDAFVPIVMALFPHLDPAAQPWQDVADAVPAALQALGNNRSGWPTRQIALASAWQGPGGQSIQRMWLPRSPRQQCRRAQELLYHAPVESALAGLNHVAATCPWSPLPLAFRGELYLWLGDFAAAEADLRQALDRWPWTRWAHAGLAAAALHGGAVQQAINWLDLGRDRMKSEGPPWRVLRGEAALQTGDAGEALPLLAEAVRVQPTRIAARWLLALAQVQAGNSAAAEVTAAELASGAPGLWQTALVAAQRQVPEPTLLVVLQAGLLLLRGCRASSFSVHARPDGQGARTIRWQPGQDQQLAAHALRRLQQLGREATP